MSVACQVLDTLGAVRAIAARWDDLLDRSACNRAFSCADWYLSACRADPELRPRVIAAFRGRRLAGVLPLVSDPRSAEVRFASPLSDYNDLIAARGDDAVLFTVADQASQLLAGGVRLVLDRLRDDSNCLRALSLAGRFGEAPQVLAPGSPCPRIALPADLEAYLAGRSAAFRKTFRRVHRSAARDGVTVARVDPSPGRAAHLAERFLAVHLCRFGGSSPFDRPRHRAFLACVLPKLVASERVLAFEVRRDGRTLAIELYPRGPDSLCAWSTGFLPDAALWSPGTLLMACALRHALDNGFAELDLLRGSERYKASWANDVRVTRNLVAWTDRRSRTPLRRRPGAPDAASRGARPMQAPPR